MHRNLFIFAMLLLTACDQSSTQHSSESASTPGAATSGSDPSPQKSTESVATVEGGPKSDVSLESIDNPALIAAVQGDIKSAGYGCDEVAGFWKIDNSTADGGAWKVDCGSSGTYQVTSLGGKEYIKPWTGVLIGQ